MKLKRIIKWTGAVVLVVLLLGVGAIFVAYWRSDNDCGRSAATPNNPMKAITYCDYGSPDVLKVEEIEKPSPADDQVLVRVRAASINPLDWHMMEGTPYVLRLQAGLRKPKSMRLGVDFAGTVEAVGKDVTDFKVGDEVFGGRDGALAEYVCPRASRAIVHKPANISFEQAASVPIAAVTALQSLRDKAHVQPGQHVLINGASGGVGTFAVQLGKYLGAEVTGVCSTRNLELVRSLGADHVIDYTKEDFTKNGQHYDVILDLVGTQPLSWFRPALKPKGICVLIGGGGPNEGRWIGPMARPVKALLLSPFVSQQFVMFIAQLKKEDLTLLSDLMQSGKVRPVVDRTFKLDQAAEAMRYLEKGHARGKVIVAVE
ncbi:MAG TPA: NAD(P)-dependent alcohol dehydrogenase [Chthoniobacterales bacterium]|jgi:NADPH:quinone reductase-like Zn-dependent oxidoreductase